MMSIRKTLLATTVLMAPAIAQAQPVTGVYVAAGAGVNWLSNISENTTFSNVAVNGVPTGQTPFSANTRINTDIGWVALASVGYGFGNGLRLEIEGNYRSNGVGGATTGLANSVVTSSSGTISSYGVMANALFDFRLGPVMPYIGGGVGYAWNRYSGVGFNATDTLGLGSALNLRFNDTSSGFAYQGIVGIAIPIASVPGLAVTAEYRYFGILASNINGRVTQAVNFGEGGLQTATATATIKPPSNNNSLLIGVRYNFGQAPRPAPVAAAPAPARSFLVFFDFASDQLTARAREIVGQAAAAARSQQVTRIEVAGHTDTVGSAQYNQGLSIRRANNVAAELVRQGVPRNAITTAGFGFTRPLVPTGPNVREPQNRRVEIVLR